MRDFSALTHSQIGILRQAREEVKPPRAIDRSPDFWADVELLIYFGLLTMRAGHMAATRRGNDYVDSLDQLGAADPDAAEQR